MAKVVFMLSRDVTPRCISEQKSHTIQNMGQVKICLLQVKFMNTCPACNWSKSLSLKPCIELAIPAWVQIMLIVGFNV